MWSFGTPRGALVLAVLAAGCGSTVVAETGTSGSGGTTSSSGGSTGGTGGAATGGTGGAATGGTGGGGAPTGGGGTGGASGCQSDDDCLGVPGGPLCDLLTGKCVSCVWDGDCLGVASGPLCDLRAGKCVSCFSDKDCAGSPGGPLCDLQTNQCVSCFVDPDPAVDCGIGAWCYPETEQCVSGCTGDADCPSPDNDLVCDVAAHICVGCVDDGGCAPGSVCVGAQCLPGCNVNHPCQAGWTCCGQTCFDLDHDANNCGFCNNPCFAEPHSQPVCNGGLCQQSTCDPGYADCDLQPANGCERNVLADGPCTCLPGSVESCYGGAPGTAGVGVCLSGSRTCDPSGVSWGPCLGQVLPGAEVCANGKDDDCDGQTDENCG